MEQKYYMGIDVSKGKLDIAIMNASREVLLEQVIINQVQSLSKFFNALIKKHTIPQQDLLVCCENTGIYTRPLELYCSSKGIFLWIESALKIKKAASELRGKSDRKDALRIAEYALRYQDRKQQFIAKASGNEQLTILLKVRDTLIEQLVGMRNQLSESKVMDKNRYKTLLASYKNPIKAIEKELKHTEEQIDHQVKEDAQMKKNMDLLTTIPGIGKQNALQFIVHTNNFERFQSANHLACYTGVVPFPNQSGISIRKDRISKLANQKLKKLLHMAALSCIRASGELKEYYLRKVKEGKNKMLVINAIRNKLVHRMFAVIKRQSAYIKNQHQAANAAELLNIA